MFPTEPLSYIDDATVTISELEITGLYSAGEGAVDPNDPDKVNTLNQLAKTEISLYLTSKYDIGDGEAIDGQSLMIK